MYRGTASRTLLPRPLSLLLPLLEGWRDPRSGPPSGGCSLGAPHCLRLKAEAEAIRPKFHSWFQPRDTRHNLHCWGFPALLGAIPGGSWARHPGFGVPRQEPERPEKPGDQEEPEISQRHEAAVVRRVALSVRPWGASLVPLRVWFPWF